MEPEATESAMIGEHGRLISESGRLNALAAAWSGAAAASALVAFGSQALLHFSNRPAVVAGHWMLTGQPATPNRVRNTPIWADEVQAPPFVQINGNIAAAGPLDDNSNREPSVEAFHDALK